MKAKLVLTSLLSFAIYLLSAQVPQGFNYQAVALGSDGHELANTALQVRLSILSDTNGFKASGTGVYIWEEEQNVTTDKFGSFTIIVGDPGATRIQGVASFSAINWKINPLFIGTKINGTGGWKPMGSAKLWSVPYSIISGDFGGSVKKLLVSASETSLDSALFEVRNKDGQTVFAVYNEGVRIYVDDGLPGKGATKGGFAIGSFDKTKAASQILFIVDPDSIRAYIDTGLVKARKGGFAIGSFGTTKAGREEYFRVSRDSSRIYINSTATKATKGGFAIGSFNNTKGLIPKYLSVNPNTTTVQVNDSTKGFVVSNIQTGVSQNFMDMTVENYFIGFQAGSLTTPGVGDIGKYNSFMGYQTGLKNVTGKKNVYLGYQSGYESLGANYNVMIGNESGKLNANGANNTFVGYWSGQNNNGDYNTFIGERAGNKNTSGTFNVFVGARSGMNVNTSTATYNVMIGSYAGYYSNDATNNVFIGGRAGMNNRTGDFNVCIGNEAGYANKWFSNRLYIANSLNYPPLIYGEFDNKNIVINDTLPHGMTFYVNGLAGGLNPWSSPSDIRLKKNIVPIANALEKIMLMRGVEFEWSNNGMNDRGRHIGFIAQEMDKILPEVVNHTGEYLSLQYAPLTAILVEAFKVQQKTIEKQQEDIDALKKFNFNLTEMNRQLQTRLDKLENFVNGK